MAVMADFARLPTQRKVLVFVVAGLLLGMAYFQFVLKPLRSDVEATEAEHVANQAQNEDLERQIPAYKALRARMCQLRRIIEENQTALPTETELPAFFETLNRKVIDAGVSVSKWQEQPEAPIEGFVKVPVSIEITGTFMQIKKFFASLVEKRKKPVLISPVPGSAGDPCGNGAPLEEHERIVSIENLSLVTPTVVNHEIQLTAKFTAMTYRQDEPAAKPGVPSVRVIPTAPAPAKVPPADTPAGAKARTDAAMQKDDDRTRKAPGTQDVQPTPAPVPAPAQPPAAGSGSAQKKGTP
jgi:Tfp pilus assembly protein PilO